MVTPPTKKYGSPMVALEAMQRYCAQLERCQQDVRTKLILGGIYGEDLESILAELISEGYLDELRYAKSYVSGKVSINKWGKQKIKQSLKQKDISNYCIDKAIQSIDQEVYQHNLVHHIQQKTGKLSMPIPYSEKNKIIQSLMTKGYSYDEILGHLPD
jgi:regulatory protein